MTQEQHAVVKRKIAELEADLAVEKGKAALLSGKFREAEAAFRSANTYRRSSKLAVVSLLTRVAPHILLKYYRSNRADEIVFIEGQSS